MELGATWIFSEKGKGVFLSGLPPSPRGGVECVSLHISALSLGESTRVLAREGFALRSAAYSPRGA
ncbi:MAG: hypothetical protein Q8Q37_02060, partial [bacterium]|nr:hypothetical protein [bacterium]